MSYTDRSRAGQGSSAPSSPASAQPAAGKQTLVAPVQQRASAEPGSSVEAAAAQGVATPSARLPFSDTIQRAFGRHDVSSIQAHTDDNAAASAKVMGAAAYATGDHVVLGQGRDLHTVAHEAAHVVQQREGVRLKRGVGAAGDAHERHADAVADAVVAGESAEALLEQGATGHAPAIQRKDDAKLLENQASLKNTDIEIPALEGALLTTRVQAVKQGLLSQASFDAGLALSQAMTQLQPAVAAGGTVDPLMQERAAVAAQQLFFALQRETSGDQNFKVQPSMSEGGAVTSQNPYTQELRVTTAFLIWSSTHDVGSWFQKLPGLIRQGAWEDAFRGYRRMLDGLDQWVADQLRKKGKGTPEEAAGNAQQHFSQLRTGLEQIADKHASRLPALFHPDAETVAKEKSAGRPAADTIPMNVYFWKDEKDGKYHIYDLTTPSRPHEQTVDAAPRAATMNTFFEEVARYPEGEVRYTMPDGATGTAPTSGKTKWYEWVGYGALAIAAVGLAFVTAGASIPATACFALGAAAGGVSAVGHLVDSARLGTATTASVVLDVAQAAASFASLGALSITWKAGSAAAALASSRWFVPLVGTAATADVVQLVALTDITFVELTKIQNGAGTDEDKQRAMSVLLAQLVVTSGLTALSVQGARNVRALSGKPLEVVEQNGVKVLRVVGDDTSISAESKVASQGDKTVIPEDDHWLLQLESLLSADEKAKLARMAKGKSAQQMREMLSDDVHAAHERVRAEVHANQQRAAVVAQSQERLADLRRQIIERGLMDEPDIKSIVDGSATKDMKSRLSMLRDKLMTKILQLEAEKAHPGSQVLSGVKVYEKLPEASLETWRANHPNKEPKGIVRRAGGLYIERGEIDSMVIEQGQSGKARVIAREEVKTGGRDTHADADQQLKERSRLFSDAAAGKISIRLEVSETDIASEIDFASDASAEKSTRGPAGKGFDKSLGMTATDLEALCKELLKNADGGNVQ